jgi:hypothetical protein
MSSHDDWRDLNRDHQPEPGMMLVINDRVRFFRHDHAAVAREVAQIINYAREARKARLSGPDALKQFLTRDEARRAEGLLP